MARPIKATPVLKGNDAKKFIEKLIKEQKNPSKKRIKTINNALNADFKYC